MRDPLYPSQQRYLTLDIHLSTAVGRWLSGRRSTRRSDRRLGICTGSRRRRDEKHQPGRRPRRRQRAPTNVRITTIPPRIPARSPAALGSTDRLTARAPAIIPPIIITPPPTVASESGSQFTTTVAGPEAIVPRIAIRHTRGTLRVSGVGVICCRRCMWGSLCALRRHEPPSESSQGDRRVGRSDPQATLDVSPLSASEFTPGRYPIRLQFEPHEPVAAPTATVQAIRGARRPSRRYDRRSSVGLSRGSRSAETAGRRRRRPPR